MYELVGYRRVDMVAEKKNDRDVLGYSCFFLVDENDPALNGRSAIKVFFSDERFPDFPAVIGTDIKIGDKLLLVFNQKGKLQGYQKLDG